MKRATGGGDKYEAARRAIPLPELWKRYGRPLAQKGQRFETSYTPCCGDGERKDAGSLFLKRAGGWSWHCFRCSLGGSAIDFVATEERISIPDAVTKLLKEGGGFTTIMGREPAARKQRTTPERKQAATESAIRTILGNTIVEKPIRDYLVKERGISAEVVQEAIDRNLLRGLPVNADAADVWLRLNVGEDVLNTAGILKAGNRRAAAAYRPMVFLAAGANTMEFVVITRKRDEDMPKALQYGDQVLPMVWKPRGEVKKILVVEGGIDVLSVVTLGFSQDTLIIGLMGAGAWRPAWIKQAHEKYPHAEWQLGLDNDSAGSGSCQRMSDALAECGKTATVLSPWGDGNDWNDTLLAARSF